MAERVPQEPQEGYAVGLVTVGDPSNVRSWSGTPYFMARALERQFTGLTRIGPLTVPWLNLFRAYGSAKRMFSGRQYSALHARPVSDRLAAKVGCEIRAAGLDAVVAPAGSTLVGGIPEDVAFIYSSDATSRLVDGYHPHYRTLSKRTRHDAERLEQAAITRADLLLYPTEWVARSAIEDYGADPSKVHVIPWGANLESPPPAPTFDDTPPDGRCRLLFVGVDWTEKGADIAVETLRCLRRDGLLAELTICGCTPPSGVDVPGLTVIPFLDKREPDQLARLQGLYRDADFFLLPTRADCYGIAFCEASAHGVPSIGTATGGVPGVVSEGENGHLLPYSANGADYAALIAEIYRDADRHRRLRSESRRVFEERLNWDAWGAQAAMRMNELLATRQTQATDIEGASPGDRDQARS
jgi:glycosyltransferase involved in cell wall biosynthesis